MGGQARAQVFCGDDCWSLLMAADVDVVDVDAQEWLNTIGIPTGTELVDNSGAQPTCRCGAPVVVDWQEGADG